MDSAPDGVGSAGGVRSGVGNRPVAEDRIVQIVGRKGKPGIGQAPLETKPGLDVGNLDVGEGGVENEQFGQVPVPVAVGTVAVVTEVARLHIAGGAEGEHGKFGWDIGGHGVDDVPVDRKAPMVDGIRSILRKEDDIGIGMKLVLVVVTEKEGMSGIALHDPEDRPDVGKVGEAVVLPVRAVIAHDRESVLHIIDQFRGEGSHGQSHPGHCSNGQSKTRGEPFVRLEPKLEPGIGIRRYGLGIRGRGLVSDRDAAAVEVSIFRVGRGDAWVGKIRPHCQTHIVLPVQGDDRGLGSERMV